MVNPKLIPENKCANTSIPIHLNKNLIGIFYETVGVYARRHDKICSIPFLLQQI